MSSPPFPTPSPVDPGPALAHDVAPAETVSPPNTFTPSRFEVESRPFRDEPPPFLCAMVGRGYQLLRGGRRIRGLLVGLGLLLVARRAPSFTSISSIVRSWRWPDFRA